VRLVADQAEPNWARFGPRAGTTDYARTRSPWTQRSSAAPRAG